MSAIWDDVVKAQLALEHVRRHARLNDQRKIAIKIGGYERAIQTLGDLVRCHTEIPEDRKHAIVERAVHDAIRANAEDLDNLIARIRNGERNYLRTRKAPHVILTRISIAQVEDMGSVRHDGATITFTPNHPHEFYLPRRAQEFLHGIRRPTNYSWVRTHIQARCHESAIREGLDRLDLIRGIWNLLINRSTGWRISSGPMKPVNKILIGPVYTLHDPQGEPAADTYWWDPEYYEPSTPTRLNGRYDQLKRFERDTRAQLRRLEFGKDVAGWIVRYTRALDNPDLRDAFLRLWAVLEDITFTGQRTHHVTVRRAARLFHEPEYHEVVLDRLKNWRNRMVHEGADTSRTESMLFNLKGYVEWGLLFPLRNGTRFRSKNDLMIFMDLPTDGSELRRRIRLHEWAYAQRRSGRRR